MAFRNRLTTALAMILSSALTAIAASAEEPPAKIKIEKLEEQPAMTIRFRASRKELAAKMGQSFGALYGYVLANKGKVVGPPFGRYHDANEDEFDVEVGLPVAEALGGSGTIMASKLPAGNAATMEYAGPYEKLRDAHQMLKEWAERNNREPNGGIWESYVSRESAAAEPKENVTKLFMALAEDDQADSDEPK